MWRIRRRLKRPVELSAEQTALLPAMRDEWRAIALATGPGDRAAAEDAAAGLYRLAGLEPPPVWIWFGSPRAHSLADAVLTENGADKAILGGPAEQAVARRLWDRVSREAWMRRGCCVARRIDKAVHGALSESRVQVPDDLWQELQRELCEETTVQALLAIWDQEFARSTAVTWDGAPWRGLSPGAFWLGSFDFLRRAVGTGEGGRLEPIFRLAREAGGWSAYEHAGALIERPAHLRCDEGGRLHAEDGPAVLYADGWALHFWHGVRVPAWVIEDRERLHPEIIRAEPNQEIRRSMLEIFGLERFVREGGADRIHEDACGTLWRFPWYDLDEPYLSVEVVNGTPEPDGTRRRYFLRVPPEMRTAAEAVAWTYGLETEEYRPVRRT